MFVVKIIALLWRKVNSRKRFFRAPKSKTRSTKTKRASAFAFCAVLYLVLILKNSPTGIHKMHKKAGGKRSTSNRIVYCEREIPCKRLTIALYRYIIIINHPHFGKNRVEWCTAFCRLATRVGVRSTPALQSAFAFCFPLLRVRMYGASVCKGRYPAPSGSLNRITQIHDKF